MFNPGACHPASPHNIIFIMDATNFIKSNSRKVSEVVESCFAEYCDIPKAQVHLLRIKAAADTIDDALQNLGAISQMAADTVGS